MKRIYFVVQGLFEKSDSIGFDCVYQYLLAQDYYRDSVQVRLFAERYDQERYPAATIESITDLYSTAVDRETLLIYHFCDGWPAFETWLEHAGYPVIVRWHNNTPPWFFGEYSLVSVKRTIAGYGVIAKLGKREKMFFMCNSQFTTKQLRVLGVENGLLPHVYPASRYLDSRKPRPYRGKNASRSNGDILLLFVGRVVAHKGHRHVLQVANKLKGLSGRRVSVCFPGRIDDTAAKYIDEIRRLADTLSIALELPGEVSNEELERLYACADVFVCLSEHEGFGLPVYEAMARDVPTLVWGTTAFAESLTGHPLMFESLDYASMAHAVMSLQDQELFARVLRHQRQVILPEYTKEVVKSQLIRSIEAANHNFQLDAPRSDGDAIRGDEPFEIDGNFVTRYDLAAYRALIENENTVGLVGAWTSQYMDVRSFVGRDGRIQKSPYCQLMSSDERHLLFGPYMELQKGNYRATFDLRFTSKWQEFPRRTCGLRLDVACTGGLLSEVDVSIGEVSALGSTSLDFVVADDVSGVEFRIRSFGFSSNGEYELQVFGVHLCKLKTSFSERISDGLRKSLSRTKELQSYEQVGHVQLEKLSSLEFANKSGVGTVVDLDRLMEEASFEKFVERSYKKILGRTADDSGREHYLDMLNSNRMTKFEVLSALMESEEAKSRNLFVL